MTKSTKTKTEKERQKAILKQRLLKELTLKETVFREVAAEYSRLKSVLSTAEESLRQHQQQDTQGPTVGSAKGFKVKHHSQEVTEKLEAEVVEARERLDTVSPTYMSKKQEVEILRDELKRNLEITLTDIAEVQEELSEQSDRASNILKTIEIKEKELFDESEPLQRYKQLCLEKENLIAKLELNEAPHGELDTLDQEIIEQRALIDKQESTLQQTLSGLKRMLADVEKHRRELEFIINEFTTSYLLNEAERAASKYLAAAAALEDQFKEILGIQGALESLNPCRGAINIVGDSYYEIQVPAFLLDVFQENKVRSSGHLFDGTDMASLEENCKRAMLEKLKKKGVEIPFA